MGLTSSRELLRSASKIALAAAAAGLLAGCGGTSSLSAEVDSRPAATETASPDTQDFIGAAAYWGAKYEANRDDIAAALSFSRNLRMMGGARQAVSVLKDVVMKAPDNAGVLSEYGKALTAAGRAKDALPFLARSAQMNNDDWTNLSAYGVALDQTGNHAAARDNYLAALKLSPNNPSVESNLALSHILEGRIDQAELIMRRIVARPDATAQMRQNLAMIETLKGNVVEAQQLAREDLPEEEATNNIAVLRQLDARNATINVQPLAPPPVPAKTSATVPAQSAAAPAVAVSTAPTAPAVQKTAESAAPAPAPAAAKAVTTPKSPYTMAPIKDDGDAIKAPATPPAKQQDAQSETTAKPVVETKPAQPAATPVAANEATGKPTPMLRKSIDVFRRSPVVSVANAQQ